MKNLLLIVVMKLILMTILIHDYKARWLAWKFRTIAGHLNCFNKSSHPPLADVALQVQLNLSCQLPSFLSPTLTSNTLDRIKECLRHCVERNSSGGALKKEHFVTGGTLIGELRPLTTKSS